MGVTTTLAWRTGTPDVPAGTTSASMLVAYVSTYSGQGHTQRAVYLRDYPLVPDGCGGCCLGLDKEDCAEEHPDGCPVTGWHVPPPDSRDEDPYEPLDGVFAWAPWPEPPQFGEDRPMTHPTGDALRAREEAPDLAVPPASFLYCNWRGVVSRRTVTPTGIRFGANEWHREPGWLLEGWDQDKKAMRTFALSGIIAAEREDARDGWLDLRSEAGRGLVEALRECVAALDREALRYALYDQAEEAEACCVPVDRARAALALLDAMKEEPHG